MDLYVSKIMECMALWTKAVKRSFHLDITVVASKGLLIQVTPLWRWIARHSNELDNARANYKR